MLRYKLFRDIEDQLETRTAHIGGHRAAQIRVHIPAPTGGNPLVLHDVDVYSVELVPPAIDRLIAADLL